MQPATRNVIPHKWIQANADEYHARNRQVHHRAAEVSRALDLMSRYAKNADICEYSVFLNFYVLNSRLNGDTEGEAVKNVLDSTGAFNLECLRGLMDVSR